MSTTRPDPTDSTAATERSPTASTGRADPLELHEPSPELVTVETAATSALTPDRCDVGAGALPEKVGPRCRRRSNRGADPPPVVMRRPPAWTKEATALSSAA